MIIIDNIYKKGEPILISNVQLGIDEQWALIDCVGENITVVLRNGSKMDIDIANPNWKLKTLDGEKKFNRSKLKPGTVVKFQTEQGVTPISGIIRYVYNTCLGIIVLDCNRNVLNTVVFTLGQYLNGCSLEVITDV